MRKHGSKGCTRVIWKLGGSVLEDRRSYAYFAKRICSYLTEHPEIERIYIVVSARKGRTDELIGSISRNNGHDINLRDILSGKETSNHITGKFDNPETSAALLRGEIESAYLLQEELRNAGMESKVFTQLDFFPIVSQGSYLYSEVDLDASKIKFANSDLSKNNDRIVIVSGFGAVNSKNEPTLLGRNSSDYVAAILSALDEKVESVTFIKDVDGLYDSFGTPEQKLIASIHIEKLRELGFRKLIDKRVLGVISCNFHITNKGMSEGTKVVL